MHAVPMANSGCYPGSRAKRTLSSTGQPRDRATSSADLSSRVVCVHFKRVGTESHPCTWNLDGKGEIPIHCFQPFRQTERNVQLAPIVNARASEDKVVLRRAAAAALDPDPRTRWHVGRRNRNSLSGYQNGRLDRKDVCIPRELTLRGLIALAVLRE